MEADTPTNNWWACVIWIRAPFHAYTEGLGGQQACPEQFRFFLFGKTTLVGTSGIFLHFSINYSDSSVNYQLKSVN